MCAVAVGSESGVDVEGGRSAGNDVEDTGGGNCACDLRDDVGEKFRRRETLAHDQAQAHGGIQVAAGDVSDGEGHGEDGEAESEGDAGESDAEGGKSGGEDGGAASAEDEPESSEEFRERAFGKRHGFLLGMAARRVAQ